MSQPGGSITILLADDQILIAQSLKIVLETQSEDLKVVGLAGDGLQVLELLSRQRPDVVLMDVRMPNMDGVEATRRVHEQSPETKVIVLTTFDDDEYVQEAIEAGAVGYLLKDISTDELIASIKAAYHGAVLISPAVASRLFGQRELHDLPLPAPLPGRELTEREKELLRLVSHGYTNKEAACKLFLAEQTVKNYLSVIYGKLGIQNRTELRKLLLRLKSTS